MAGGALAALSGPLARLPLVAFGTGAVEVFLHAVTRGLFLAGVGLAGLPPAGNLLKSERKSHPSPPGTQPRINLNLKGNQEAANQQLTNSGPVRQLSKAQLSRPSWRCDTDGALAEATVTPFSVYTEKMAVFI